VLSENASTSIFLFVIRLLPIRADNTIDHERGRADDYIIIIEIVPVGFQHFHDSANLREFRENVCWRYWRVRDVFRTTCSRPRRLTRRRSGKRVQRMLLFRFSLGRNLDILTGPVFIMKNIESPPPPQRLSQDSGE